MTAPRLVIGIGNPSRGDDALGPLCIERLEALDLPGVELLTDFQLQVEYVLDLHGRAEVVFVDATVSGPEPYALTAVEPQEDHSISSHALSPAALLAAYRRHWDAAPPPASVLAIRGRDFELGEGLSAAGRANLEAAMHCLERHLRGQSATRIGACE